MQWIILPGLTEYNFGLKLMEQSVDKIINGGQEIIYLLEHNDVYTAGTSYKPQELLNNIDIPVIYTGRGGRFTYHGPGQRIIYPILNLAKKQRTKDIKLYVKKLEEWIINTLLKFNIKAYTMDNMVGIWTDCQGTKAKIAAIGIRVRKWVAYHGIAVNIDTDLTKFQGIIPCGINNFPVTSLKELKGEISLEEFDLVLKEEFNKIFY